MATLKDIVQGKAASPFAGMSILLVYSRAVYRIMKMVITITWSIEIVVTRGTQSSSSVESNVETIPGKMV